MKAACSESGSGFFFASPSLLASTFSASVAPVCKRGWIRQIPLGLEASLKLRLMFTSVNLRGRSGTPEQHRRRRGGLRTNKSVFHQDKVVASRLSSWQPDLKTLHHCAAVAMETERIRRVSTSGQQSGASRLKIIPLANLRRPGGADSSSGKPFPLRECESQVPVDLRRDLISPGHLGYYSKCHCRSQVFKSQTFTDAQPGWNFKNADVWLPAPAWLIL